VLRGILRELTERANIIPAPYLARAKWVALETSDALPRGELAELLRASYNLVVAKLPKKDRPSWSIRLRLAQITQVWPLRKSVDSSECSPGFTAEKTKRSLYSG